MNLRIITAIAMTTAILSLIACNDSRENDEPNNVVLLNKDLLEEQIKASDNGYCPLLPYPFDPRTHWEQGGSMSDSEEKSFQEQIEAWQEEVWRVRRDPTRNATVTLSKGQTIVNLSPVFVEVILDLVQLKDSKKNDTLHIKAVPGPNGSYGRMKSMNNCPISLDFALNYILDENVKVLVFEEEQIFQVKF
jgi:hypothetical protein